MWLSFYYLPSPPPTTHTQCILNTEFPYVQFLAIFSFRFPLKYHPYLFSLYPKLSYHCGFWISFLHGSRPHFNDIQGWLLDISLCFTECQTQLPTNEIHHLFYIIWDLENSINNCFYLTSCVIGHHALSIILSNVSWELSFSASHCIVIIQILRIPYLDYCNNQNDFIFSSLMNTMIFYINIWLLNSLSQSPL